MFGLSKSFLIGFGLAVSALTLQFESVRAADSTWDQIHKTGVLRMGVTEYPPYFVNDQSTGEWKGALVDMGQDMAKVLNVKFEPVEVAGFEQAVLSIQSNKVDMFLGLNATPTRITAIDFAGPIYWIGTVIVNGKNFHGDNWADYDKPEVKIAAIRGGADAAVVRRMAPKATLDQFNNASDITLAVASGRADALVLTTLSGLVAKSKGADLGNYVYPKPEVALPTYVGIRFEDDQRFQKFVNRWAEWNLLTGANDERMLRSLDLLGIKDVPPGLHFSH